MTVKIIYLNGAFEFMRDVNEIKKNEHSFIIVQRNGFKRELDQRLTLEVKFYQSIYMCTDSYHVEIESGDIISLSFNNSVYIGMVESVLTNDYISVILLERFWEMADRALIHTRIVKRVGGFCCIVVKKGELIPESLSLRVELLKEASEQYKTTSFKDLCIQRRKILQFANNEEYVWEKKRKKDINWTRISHYIVPTERK